MGGDFNFKHFVDPLGLTIGKGQGGGAKAFWDPANIFTKGQPGASAAAAGPTVPNPVVPATMTDASVLQAQEDIQRKAKTRGGIASTVHAGDSGAWLMSQQAPSAPGTKLGY